MCQRLIESHLQKFVVQFKNRGVLLFSAASSVTLILSFILVNFSAETCVVLDSTCRGVCIDRGTYSDLEMLFIIKR
jgi:hypothetical protein